MKVLQQEGKNNCPFNDVVYFCLEKCVTCEYFYSLRSGKKRA